jgi:tRNA pseudouridine55 synthase
MGTDGLLVLDKPQGITSRDAVDRAQRWFPRRTKLGHTGTLDPLATGVLVLCVGGATRLVEYVQRMSKTYDSTFRLGATSDSDDADGTVTPRPGASDPGVDAVRAALARLVGTLDQVPPAYSAAHVAGQRAYDLARRGAEVNLEPRRVTVYGIEVRRYAYPELDVSVECGKGTYIRSLARDLGAALGIGAYVQTLRRTRVGPFTPDMAVPLEVGTVRLLPTALALAELPRLDVDAATASRLRQGQAVRVENADADEVAVFGDGTPVGVGAVKGGVLRSGKVLPPVS